MAITDAERHRLHTKLDEMIGEEDAATLMAHLPPSGWSDVVRTRDLDQFEARMETRFQAIDHRFESLEQRLELKIEATVQRAMREQTNRYLLGLGAFFSVFATVQALLA